MTGILEHPEISRALRTGYPSWMLPELPWSEGEGEDPELELWFSILSNLEHYGNPAGACLYELPEGGQHDMKMSYQERLRRYERDKRELRELGLPAAEYEERLKELLRKWRI